MPGHNSNKKFYWGGIMKAQMDRRFIAKKTAYSSLATAAAVVALCAASAMDALAASPLVLAWNRHG